MASVEVISSHAEKNSPDHCSSIDQPESPSAHHLNGLIEDMFGFIDEDEEIVEAPSSCTMVSATQSSEVNTPSYFEFEETSQSYDSVQDGHSPSSSADGVNMFYKHSEKYDNQSDSPTSPNMLKTTKSILCSKACTNSQNLIRSVIQPGFGPTSSNLYSLFEKSSSPQTTTYSIFKHFHSSLLGASPTKSYLSYNNLNSSIQSSNQSTIPQFLKRKLNPVPSPSDDFVVEPNKQCCGFAVGKKFAPPKLSDDSDYKEQCGEDAFFTFENEEYSIMGVADGVGGWSEVGVDPSLISNQLMLNCREICEKEPSKLSNPNSILQSAYDLINNLGQVQAGSTTACIVSYERKTNILRTSNLGDSGCAIFREGACVFQTQERQHYFNCPFQLGVVPPEMKSTAYHDKPEHAVNEEIKLEKGDVVVLATDGVWDNLFPEDIGEIIVDMEEHCLATATQGSTSHPLESCELAKAITLQARKVGLDRTARTPFYVGSQFRFLGGKFDDVTTVCFIA